MVDSVGIIHMNGRIYDPKLGRFLQADPFIQAPYNTQSLNRYSYVMNNPLNATDPSGYFAWTWVVNAIIAYVAVDAIVTIGINSGWGSGVIQVVSFVASCWINACFDLSNISQSMSQVFGMQGLQMGIIGGITSVIGGGKFGHGFVSAGIAAGGASPGASAGSAAKSGISPGEFIGRTVLGGTLSKISGGKFANGAAGTAFGMMVQVAAAGLNKSDQSTGAPDRRASTKKTAADLSPAELADLNGRIKAAEQRHLGTSHGKGEEGTKAVALALHQDKVLTSINDDFGLEPWGVVGEGNNTIKAIGVGNSLNTGQASLDALSNHAGHTIWHRHPSGNPLWAGDIHAASQYEMRYNVFASGGDSLKGFFVTGDSSYAWRTAHSASIHTYSNGAWTVGEF